MFCCCYCPGSDWIRPQERRQLYYYYFSFFNLEFVRHPMEIIHKKKSWSTDRLLCCMGVHVNHPDSINPGIAQHGVPWPVSESLWDRKWSHHGRPRVASHDGTVSISIRFTYFSLFLRWCWGIRPLRQLQISCIMRVGVGEYNIAECNREGINNKWSDPSHHSFQEYITKNADEINIYI